MTPTPALPDADAAAVALQKRASAMLFDSADLLNAAACVGESARERAATVASLLAQMVLENEGRAALAWRSKTTPKEE